MKKYLIAGLLVLGFLVPAYSFAQSTQTLPSDIDPLENESTCVSLVNNLRYRSRDANTNGEVSTLQDYLQSKSYLNSEPTGYFGLLTLKAVKAFQKENKINPTGFVGPITRAKIKDLSCGGTTNPSVVTISGVSGPESLKVNEQGTWTVKASSTTGGTLSYSVAWGDEVVLTTQGVNELNRPYPGPQQSATFTHAYTKGGIYKPTFTVTSANTINCITTPCPGNEGSAQVSLTVKVAGAGTPSNYMSVLSPNGGEKWAKGTTQTIKWQDNTPVLTSCPAGTGCVRPMPQYYDIKLISYGPTCTNLFCTNSMRPIRDTRVIATNVAGLSYEWKIQNCNATNTCSTNFNITEGSYFIEVCQAGTSNCDSSDKGFNIVNSTVSTGSITVLSPNGGESWAKGKNQNIKWTNSNTSIRAQFYDIILQPTCAGDVCTDVYRQPYTIAKKVSGESYDWSVGKVLAPLSASSETIQNTTAPDGAYIIKVCETGTSNCDSSDKYFSVINGSIVVNTAKLYVTPENATVKMGGTTELKAMYQPAEPACVSAVPSCKIATPAPYAVVATWTSSDTKVATVAYKDTCPPGAYCLMQQLDKKIAVITGVSEGGAVITASYKDPNGKSTASAMTATAKITVTSNPIAICDYAAPPTGCMYVNEGNYDPITQCGLVLKCDGTGINEKVLGAESFKFNSLLKLGSKGDEVTELQKFLNNKGYNTGTPDGNFGQKTKEAIMKFQLSNGLTADGVVGALVRAILNK